MPKRAGSKRRRLGNRQRRRPPPRRGRDIGPSRGGNRQRRRLALSKKSSHVCGAERRRQEVLYTSCQTFRPAAG
jgi:hypothetical protein